MKRIILIGCLLIGFSTSLFSQEIAVEPKVTLPDSVMEQVVKRIVSWYFKSPQKPKTIYFAAENIKKEWFPKIKNLEFVTIEKQSSKRDKHALYYFNEVVKADKDFLIGFGYGNPDCGGKGDTWQFRVVGSRVRLQKTGGTWGMFCSGPNDHA